MILTKYWQIPDQNMDYKIKLTNRALKDIDQTISFLLHKWTATEARNFLNKLEDLKITIAENPLLFPFYDKDALIHKVVLTKHNIVFYQVVERNKVIHIITIFNVYQNPEKLKL